MSSTSLADTRAETGLWLAQRASAAVLAVCVLVHLAGITAAVQGGLTAAEIIARVGGNAAWATFYGIFVVAAAVHGPIGLRTILAEMTPFRGLWVNTIVFLFALAMLVMGFGAVIGLYRLGGIQ